MKQRRAERLTGYEVRRITGSYGRVRFGAYDGEGQLIAEVTQLIDDLALDLLVKKVLQIHSVEALERSHWSCARCHGTTLADSPSALPPPRRTEPSRESGAGLRGMPQGHPSTGTVEVKRA